ncbi:unnamed protein product [Diplocarpon coronariae]|nr:hypothetical protein JHW43_004002 [Diplocarpon mali]
MEALWGKYLDIWQSFMTSPRTAEERIPPCYLRTPLCGSAIRHPAVPEILKAPRSPSFVFGQDRLNFAPPYDRGRRRAEPRTAQESESESVGPESGVRRQNGVGTKRVTLHFTSPRLHGLRLVLNRSEHVLASSDLAVCLREGELPVVMSGIVATSRRRSIVDGANTM